MWDRLIPKLDSVQKLKEKEKTLPDSAIFGDDRESNRKEINRLLDEAASILILSPSFQYRQTIQKFEKEIQESNRQIVKYEEEKVTAPSSKPLWKPWVTTAEGYDEKIKDERNKIERAQQKIAESKSAMREELNQSGLSLTDDQLDFLLSTVVGDSVIDISLAFQNVRAVTLQLEEIMVKSGENVNAAKRYYGMYAVLLEILDHMYLRSIEEIDTQYIPRIEGGKGRDGKKIVGIIPQTQKLLKQTQELQQSASDKNRDVLAANVQAQKLTLEAARLYRTFLDQQRSAFDAAQKKLAPDLATARNTYETVTVSSELVSLMRSSQNLFETLRSLQMPELRVFQNLEMKREFEKLTLQLEAAS